MDYAKKIVYQSNYWYNDGLRKAQIRDMSGAVKSLKISLQFNRENIAARNLLGLVYYGIGEVAEALVEWIISKNLRPRDNIADYYIKKVQASANELETINQAVKKYNQCLGYCRQNGEDLAIIQLKQVITSHPSFLKAHQLLALLYLHTEQYSRARQILRIARRLDTANEITLRYMHELTVRRGKSRRAGKKKKEDPFSGCWIKPAQTFSGEGDGIAPCSGKYLHRSSDRGCDHLVSGRSCGRSVQIRAAEQPDEGVQRADRYAGGSDQRPDKNIG